MAKESNSKHLNSLGVSDQISYRPGVPGDYHCSCPYCNPARFMGEMFATSEGKYYSNRIRKGYYKDGVGDHLDVGQFVGYRWAIQNLCPEDGWVFDPTVGSGTAIVEAINNGRNAVGIELEYPDTAMKTIKHQDSLQEGVLIPGDARNLSELLTNNGFGPEKFDLIINGTPYPSNGVLSSDAPQRDPMIGKEGKGVTFNYNHNKNMGLTSGENWRNTIRGMYTESIKFLKPGGRFVIIVKDMIRDKKAYLLHKEIIDLVLEDNMDMEYEGFFLHKHLPTTMFINTYNKRFPEVIIPIYQTGIVLKKSE